jgi:flagellar motor switch protein FliN/FliY
MAEQEHDQAKEKQDVTSEDSTNKDGQGNIQPPSANGDGQLTLNETLNEILLTVVVEVGRTVMAVKDICRQFRAGNVLRLDKRKGEPLEVHVNGLLFARAEVVFEGEQIGARIIEIVDPEEASRYNGLAIR